MKSEVIFKIVKSKKNGKEYVVASIDLGQNIKKDVFLDDKEAFIVRTTYKF